MIKKRKKKDIEAEILDQTSLEPGQEARNKMVAFPEQPLVRKHIKAPTSDVPPQTISAIRVALCHPKRLLALSSEHGP